MKPPIRTICKLPILGLLLLGSAATLPAQSTDPMVYAVGLVAGSSEQHWAYLHWRSTDLDLLSPQAWSVWRKDGGPDTPGEFRLDAVVQVQRNPQALQALFERSQSALGEDLQQTALALREMFEDILPGDDLQAADLASAILLGVEDSPALTTNLQFVLRAFPSMAMALGTAHATPIRSNGPVTFEIRQRMSPTSADVAVVGRVTVDATSPLALPAPGPVVLAPVDSDRPATSDMSISLRWATPANLLRLGLAQHGYNVWRVPRAIAENAGWHTTPPAAGALASLELDPATLVGRVNRRPILIQQVIDPTNLALITDPQPIFATDHESRFPGDPEPQTVVFNGDQYYYFVSALDLLGRDGALSQPVLGTFCSRLPPRVPVIQKAENVFADDNGTPRQVIRLTWEANPPEVDKVTTEYAVYRWANTEQLVLQGGDPLAQLIATIPHPASGSTVSWLDDGPGAPGAPDDYGKSFWYTVRAIDDSALGSACAQPPFDGNLSSHSPPFPASLRDFSNPGQVVGSIGVRCSRADVIIQPGLSDSLIERDDLNPGIAYYNLQVMRPVADPNLNYFEIFWTHNGTRNFVGQFSFAGSSLEFNYLLALPNTIRPGSGARILFEVEAVTSSGIRSAAVPLMVDLPSASKDEPPLYYAPLDVFIAVDYPLSIIGDTRRSLCETHQPIPPELEQTDPGLQIVFLLPPGTRQYKIFYQIDDGPFTLLRERSGTFDPDTPIEEVWDGGPVFAQRVCLFVQAYDRHGNPGPMSLIGCLGMDWKLFIPPPFLKPLEPEGNLGDASVTIRWAGPSYGISHYELMIRTAGGPMLATPEGFIREPVLEVANINDQQLAFSRYISPRVDTGFGNAGLYDVTFNLPTHVEWLVFVRGVSHGGKRSIRSNVEYFTWSPPEAYLAPEVPWPARALPADRTAASFNPDIMVKFSPNGGRMIRIGQADVGSNFNFTTNLLTTVGDPTTRVYPSKANPNRSLFPMVVYRVQVPDAEFPDVSGDVIQVSPLMEKLTATSDTAGVTWTLRDPYIVVEPFIGAIGSGPIYLYLRDTQPAIARARYQYYLLLMNPDTKEIDEVLVLPAHP